MMHRLSLSSPTITFGFLLLLTFWRVAELWGWSFSLYADEAQYWLWAQTPDWGYYSKPPMVAWAIALTTWLGSSDAVFWVKLASPIAYLGTSMLVYAIAAQLYDVRTACWSAMMFATIPGVALSSTIISTDPFLLLFWALGIYAFARAIGEDGHPWRWWVLCGVACGFGMLSKYNMLFFALSVFLYSWWQGNGFRLFRSVQLWVAVAIAFALFAPNIWWNWQHGFVSFAHTGDITQLDEKESLLHPLQLLEFIAAQAALVGPILFVLIGIMLVRFRRVLRTDAPGTLLVSFVLPMLGFILVLSVLTRAHGNWAAPIYVPAIIWVTHCMVQQGKHFWLAIAVAMHLFAAGVVYHYDALARGAGVVLSDKTDPYVRVRGSTALGEAVSEVMARYPNATLLTDGRKLAATLAYHARPYGLSLVKWNDSGQVKDHWELTTSLEDALPWTSYMLVVPAPTPPLILARFSSVKKLEPIIIHPYGAAGDDLSDDKQRKRIYDVYLLQGFQGYQ